MFAVQTEKVAAVEDATVKRVLSWFYLIGQLADRRVSNSSDSRAKRDTTVVGTS